jgi:hypothetical protein
VLKVNKILRQFRKCRFCAAAGQVRQKNHRFVGDFGGWGGDLNQSQPAGLDFNQESGLGTPLQFSHIFDKLL